MSCRKRTGSAPACAKVRVSVRGKRSGRQAHLVPKHDCHRALQRPLERADGVGRVGSIWLCLDGGLALYWRLRLALRVGRGPRL